MMKQIIGTNVELSAASTTAAKGSKHEECTVCGYIYIPKIDSHNHDYGTEWKYDSTNHWHECEDGETRLT